MNPKRRWSFWLQSSFILSNLSHFLSQLSRCAARRIPPKRFALRATHLRALPSRCHDDSVKRTPLRRPKARSPERCFFPDHEPKLEIAQHVRPMWMNRDTLRASKRVVVLPPRRRCLAPFRSRLGPGNLSVVGFRARSPITPPFRRVDVLLWTRRILPRSATTYCIARARSCVPHPRAP